MARPLATPLVVAGLLILVSPAPAATAPTVEALGWMAGCWRGEGGGGPNQECWTAPEGGIMLGVSRVITEKGTLFELLRIAPHGDGLAFLPSPGGKPPVPFAVVEAEPNRAVFANPEHDFPQRLTYVRDGDAMTARVEARRDDGTWGGFEVRWRRDYDGWAGTAAADDADPAAEVRAAETAFAATMAQRDFDGFTSYLAEEAVFLSAFTARGRDQVAALWRGFFEQPEPPFSWSPETVEVLSSGGLALSTGPVFGPEGRLVARYASIWRREAPGRWRVVFDKGEAVCAE